MFIAALLIACLASAPEAPAPVPPMADAPRAASLVPSASPAAAPKSPQAPAAVARPDMLTFSWPLDGAIVLVTGSGWITTEILKSELAPSGCKWCGQNGFDNAVTRSLAWQDIEAAATVGDLTGFLATPLATIGTLALASGREDRLAEMPANVLLMVEAVTVSSALNQLVKFSAGRERPFVADLPPELKGATKHPADNNLSFYSGHSNLAFALAVSAGTIAHLRGYQAEPYVWGAGVPLAAFVAYSRIAAKKHYLSDVLLGSATGAALGFALPWFFHKRAEGATALTIAPLPNGAAIAGRF